VQNVSSDGKYSLRFMLFILILCCWCVVVSEMNAWVRVWTRDQKKRHESVLAISRHWPLGTQEWLILHTSQCYTLQ